MPPLDSSNFVVRVMEENGCRVTSVIYDPADAQQLVYGTVTRDGVLVGSFYPDDQGRQTGWRVVTANGRHFESKGVALELKYDGDAIYLLTRMPTPEVPQKDSRGSE